LLWVKGAGDTAIARVARNGDIVLLSGQILQHLDSEAAPRATLNLGTTPHEAWVLPEGGYLVTGYAPPPCTGGTDAVPFASILGSPYQTSACDDIWRATTFGHTAYDAFPLPGSYFWHFAYFTGPAAYGYPDTAAETIAVNQNRDISWTSKQWGTAVRADRDGNAYVGRAKAISKLDWGDGSVDWANPVGAPATAFLDFYASYPHYNDMAVSQDGYVAWVQSFHGGATVGPTFFRSPDDRPAGFLVLLDPTGNLVRAMFLEPDRAVFSTLRLAFDDHNNLYLAGVHRGHLKVGELELDVPSLDPNQPEIFVASFNVRGEFRDVARVATEVGQSDPVVTKLDVDQQGNVYLLGSRGSGKLDFGAGNVTDSNSGFIAKYRTE